MKSTFAERLKELRVEKGLSQVQLVKALENKVSQTSVSCWELGQRIPTLDAVILLADFFGVTLDYISGRED